MVSKSRNPLLPLLHGYRGLVTSIMKVNLRFKKPILVSTDDNTLSITMRLLMTVLMYIPNLELNWMFRGHKNKDSKECQQFIPESKNRAELRNLEYP